MDAIIALNLKVIGISTAIREQRIKKIIMEGKLIKSSSFVIKNIVPK